MDVSQRFLNNAKERPLQSERQLIDLRARPELDGEPRAIGIPVDVLADGRAQSIGVQGWRLHQIAEGAKLLKSFLHGSLNFVPKLRLFPPRASFGPETHEVEVGGDKMLRGRVVQFLRNALA